MDLSNPGSSEKIKLEGLMANASTTAAVSLIDKESTNKVHDEIAWETMKLLMAKCQPNDRITSAELKTELNEVTMKVHKNLDTLSSEFAQMMALIKWQRSRSMNMNSQHSIDYTSLIRMEQRRALLKEENLFFNIFFEVIIKH